MQAHSQSLGYFHLVEVEVVPQVEVAGGHQTAAAELYIHPIESISSVSE